MPLVWIRRQRWRVLDRTSGHPLVASRAVHRETGVVRTFLEPAESVTAEPPARPRRVSWQQAVARLAGHAAGLRHAFLPNAAADARVDLLPFQLEPALAILAGRRRVLIADGVGMGKTIQAALLLRAVRDSSPHARALVIAPATLHDQWIDELRARFDERAVAATAGSLASIRGEAPYLTNPWLHSAVWIASPDFLKQPHVANGLPTEPWDLLIVDEAHVLSGDSQRHEAINDLAHRARRVCLLTATPHDGDDGRYRRLLAIGSNGERLVTFRRTGKPSTAGRCVRWLHVPLSHRERRTLEVIDSVDRLAGTARTSSVSALPLIAAVFRRRLLSSSDALHRSLERRLAFVNDDVVPDWEQPGLFDSDRIDADEEPVLSSPSGLAASTERAWLERIRHACGTDRRGGRLAALATLLARRHEPVIVFTCYRDTVEPIVSALPRDRTRATLHGGMPHAEQMRAVRAFLRREVDTLVATDVASQGLNLQSRARWMICFDPPWTPLRLEQRIGRVDRIGQGRRVHATILTTRHAADRDLRARLGRRAAVSTTADLSACTRWTKAARLACVTFARQRALRTHWRSVALPEAAEAIAPSALITGLLGRSADGCECYRVSLTGPQGEVIDELLLAAPLRTTAEAVIEACRSRAHTLEARVQTRHLHASTIRMSASVARQADLFAIGPADEMEPRVPKESPAIVIGEPQLVARFIRTRSQR